MIRRQHVVIVGWSLAVALVLAWAQPGMGVETPKDEATSAVKQVRPGKRIKAAKARWSRLPRYYRTVVDEKQREAIYAIMNDYGPRIAELQAQLDALKAERDKKIEALLTGDQLKKVTTLNEENRAEREKAKAAKKAKAKAESSSAKAVEAKP